ncbi:hypothetical protein [Helicobacter ailurogastricus]|uniref:hypothetical protein n=1 Tax=Helicobacter ailurogastricus TaxID=1578720 RepID=UPI000CF0BE5E|nr:hypothetical protein [Helicobacter ailurogastricus]
MIDNIIENVSDFFKSVWAWVKHIYERILNFFKNIVAWFKDPKRAQLLIEDKNKIAVVIKSKLDNGDYNTINCLFNTDTGQVEGEEALGIESEELDAETKKNFGDKDMIVLK